MIKHNLLPSTDLLPTDPTILPSVKAAALALTEIFGDYKLTAIKFEHNRQFKRNSAHELCNIAHDLTASYDKTLKQLRALLNQADKYNGNKHAQYLQDLPAQLQAGFKSFIADQVQALRA